MNILEKIIAQKKLEIAALDAPTLRRAAESSPAPRDFLAALKRRRIGLRPSLIAELKRASPSKGILAPHLDLFQVADIYTQNGAAAISVLTDEKFFMGSLTTLRELRARNLTPDTSHVTPLLRKDFTIDETQIYEARANGADAILLIAAALTDDKHFADLHACARSLGLTALVEVHDEAETERALKLKDVKLIGINNRNLATFEVSLATTERLRPMISPEIAVVAESGIFTSTDVARLAKINIDAILVGEALVTSNDIPAKVRELSGYQVYRFERSNLPTFKHLNPMTSIKICGIKTLTDALAAIEAGADYLGFNFYSKSVRFIDKETCAEITSVLKREHPQIKLVGVFVNSSVDEVKNILETCSLDLAQLHGDETPEVLNALNGKAFKAIRLSAQSVQTSVHPFAKQSVGNPALLVDAAVKGMYGGSGVTADWSAAAELAKKYPLLLAGGLTPENVADAVRRVKPWGVDVASGVESTAGEKDAAKISAFVKAVRTESKVS